MANNVYICQFSLDKAIQYKIRASIKDSGFDYPDIKDILMIKDEDNDEVSLKKKLFFPFSSELTNANHFSIQSKIVPDALWTGIDQREIQLPTKQDYIFSIWNGGRVFNQSCANILKQHRLGENILTPIQIYDLSTGELVSDEVFYFLNLYERRQYICEVQSNKELDSIPTSYGVNSFSGYITNQEVDVAKSALDCDVDLWYDPRFLGRFFMSERLHDALSEAGMIDKFKAYTCNLI